MIWARALQMMTWALSVRVSRLFLSCPAVRTFLWRKLRSVPVIRRIHAMMQRIIYISIHFSVSTSIYVVEVAEWVQYQYSRLSMCWCCPCYLFHIGQGLPTAFHETPSDLIDIVIWNVCRNARKMFLTSKSSCHKKWAEQNLLCLSSGSAGIVQSVISDSWQWFQQWLSWEICMYSSLTPVSCTRVRLAGAPSHSSGRRYPTIYPLGAQQVGIGDIHSSKNITPRLLPSFYG